MTITFAGRIASNGLTGYGQETGNASGLTLIADPTGVAGNVLRAHMALGDALAGGSYRSEISTFSTKAPIGAIAWYWFETYIPVDWIDGGNLVTIWQMHDTADGGDNAARPPPFECTIDNGDIVFAAAACTSDVSDVPVPRSGFWHTPLIKGRWVSWVVKVDWEYTATGTLSVWKNRRLVYAETGKRLCYNDVVGIFPKFGVYVPNGLSIAIPSRTVLHRGMVTGDAAYSTFDQFMSAAGAGVTELESVASGSICFA